MPLAPGRPWRHCGKYSNPNWGSCVSGSTGSTSSPTGRAGRSLSTMPTASSAARDARRTYEVGGTLTGFEFGSRKTKTLLARLYDKTADVAAKDTGWWHEVWSERYIPGLPVHRLEFEFGRQSLVEFDLNTPDQVLGAAGDLWAYATGEWLTYRSPTGDQTCSRWPLAPEWQQVQAATLGHRAVGLERLRLARRSTSIEKLLPGLTGYLASLGALIGTEGIDDTLGAIGHHLHTYEIVSHTQFADRVARRRSELELR